MRQLPCPQCGAPMWEGGRCPWDRGSGCVGRSLVVSKARKRPETAATPKVAPVSAPRAIAAARPQRRRLAPDEARARRIARSAAYNAAHRTRKPIREATCAKCGVAYETRHTGSLYCSVRCRTAVNNRNARNRHPKLRTRRIGKAAATCHPDRLLQAKGLCSRCYKRQWDQANHAA